jgi:hypothetical protein
MPEDAPSELSKRAYVLYCDAAWRSLCVYDYETYCSYTGALKTDYDLCKQYCECDSAGISPCRGCYVHGNGTVTADGGSDEVDGAKKGGAVETDGAAQIAAEE